VPDRLVDQAEVSLSSGVPFVTDDQVDAALDSAGITGEEADAIVETNASARIVGLRAALAVLAVICLLALVVAGGIPTRQPSDLVLEGGPPGRPEGAG